jgi:nitroreductase
MIALTSMMLMAEALGLETAPMAGFDSDGVKKEFELPANAEVVALLAIGFAREADKNFGGRPALEDMIYAEEYGHPWKDPVR